LFVNKAVRGEYMNWTIDFRGGTQIHYAFKNKQTHAPVHVDAAKIRDALGKAGEEGYEISEIDWNEANAAGQDEHIEGVLVRTPRFSAIRPEVEARALDEFQKKFGTDRQIVKASWSGDNVNVRAKKFISNVEAKPVFAAAGLDLKPWTEQETTRFGTPDESSGDFTMEFSMQGLAEQFKQLFEKQLPDTEVIVAQSYGVGAKAGDKLRDDAAKSIIYSIFLIMLYLAFRFDIRYAPGAAFATIHDAVMVIGVFALTWTDVSLVSVAGLLTVMGYSTNDTVIVFDRIRENQAKLKDKKIERIIDISINEMLVRTILTSSTVFATTLIMNIFGTGEVRIFAFAMNIGVIVGTYSSIFLAAPIFMWISRKWYSGPAPARRRPAPVSMVPSPDAPAGSESDG
jgi:preprotein translocase subunit SecF